MGRVKQYTFLCVEQMEKPTVTSVEWEYQPVKKMTLSLYLTMVNVTVRLK